MPTSTTTTVQVALPRPSAPGVLTNNLLQNVSVYRSLRNLIDITNSSATGLTNIGSVATIAPDGTPATFTTGLDAALIRVTGAGNAANLGISNEWVAGGGQTQVAHGLNRVPIGYWVVRNALGAMVSDGDSAWDSTYIYFHTTHSDSDCILMIF